ncbi:MAG: GntR family transcriptional regulator [Acidobacteriaceae bacterium]|nr:GntR family transcriptional regulator [Acidobacteriaceae bacterium]MBV9500850.1 GntR family transcriptional regulator [Acidobacteriaceae bacterium]
MSGSSNSRRVFQFHLDLQSGMPVYRQIIDQVTGGIASGALSPGDQLPTVRQLAVDLAINPNTVIRAYRELEIRGVLDTQQGTGTFISRQRIQRDDAERQRRLNQMVTEIAARAGSAGFTIDELIDRLREVHSEEGKKRR